MACHQLVRSHYLNQCWLTHLPLVLHICVSKAGQHWFRYWLVAYSAPSHYLNQCWVFVNWTLRNKLQWNFNQNIRLFIHKNVFENAFCEMGVILFRGRWVKPYDTIWSVCYDPPCCSGVILLIDPNQVPCTLLMNWIERLGCQKKGNGSWISNYIHNILWHVITYPCPRYLLLAQVLNYGWPVQLTPNHKPVSLTSFSLKPKCNIVYIPPYQILA